MFVLCWSRPRRTGQDVLHVLRPYVSYQGVQGDGFSQFTPEVQRMDPLAWGTVVKGYKGSQHAARGNRVPGVSASLKGLAAD